MSYWFNEETVPELVRPVSPVFECDDREILARILEITP